MTVARSVTTGAASRLFSGNQSLIMKNQKTILVSALGLALLVAVASVATAAADPAPAPATNKPHDPHGELRARVGEKLGLTADQQSKLETIRAQQRGELEALKANPDLAPDARRSQAMEIMRNRGEQMKAVLSPEQQVKMAAIRHHVKNRAKEGARHHQAQGRQRGANRSPGMQAQRQPDPLAIVAMSERIKDQMAEKLGLTNEQRDKLEHLGRDFRAQQRAQAQKHREEMRAVLTPEQQKKAEQMKKHFRRGQQRPPARVGMNDQPDDMGGADGDLESEVRTEAFEMSDRN